VALEHTERGARFTAVLPLLHGDAPIAAAPSNDARPNKETT